MTYTSYYEYATAEDLAEAKDEILMQIGDLEKKLHNLTVKAAHLTKSVYNTSQVVNQYMGGGNITDTPYGVGWDGVTETAPSANAVYDALVSTTSSLSSLSSTVDGHTTTLGTHSSDITTLYNNVSNKANTASPTLTGTPLAPTATAGTNTTQIANTAFVTTAVSDGVGTVNQYSDEKVDDRVNALLSVSVPITKTYDDVANTLSLGVNTFGTSQVGVVPASGGETVNYLRADGTWSTPPDNNTTYSNFTSSTAGLVPASGGGTTNFLRADGTWTAAGGGGTTYDINFVTKRPFYFSDFFSASTAHEAPFTGAAVSSGTRATAATNTIESKDHPGIVRITSSTTTNSGWRYHLEPLSFRLGGGEVFSCSFRCGTFTNTTTRIGFHDTATSSDAVDGCYIEINTSGVATAKTASNSTRTSNATTVTLSTATWYTLIITVNSDATSVNFVIRNDAGSTLLNVNNTANIPTGASRECCPNFITTNSGTTATLITSIDYMCVGFATDRAR